MTSNTQDFITPIYTNLLRSKASKFKCDICSTGQTFPSEPSWWKHYIELHGDLISGFDEEAQTQFREAKKEVCRIRRGNSNAQVDKKRDDNKGDGDQWVDFYVEKSPIPANPGITGQLEGLKIQPARYQQRPPDPDPGPDVEMPDRPSSPIHDSIRVMPHHSSPQRHTRHTERRTRAAKARGGASGPTGRRIRKEPFDSDFDRSLPNAPNQSSEDGGKPTRRLFDPARDTVASFRAAEDASKRLETVAGPSLQNPPRNAGAPRRGRKEHRENSRNRPTEALGAQHLPEGRPQSLSIQPPSRLPPVVISSHEEFGPNVFKNYNQYSQQPHSPKDEPPPEDEESLRVIRQPETRPISGEQLISEVKGIYAGLVMVEAKCIEVDQRQAAMAKQVEAEGQKQPKLNNGQWQALIALHRTLLHEHHDFFLASQHPSASLPLKRLASKYSMPARMWRHGIHSFLELLRFRLPESLEHMLNFIYIAYSIVALLYETVPAFEDTWIECLGDLGRYRMAIEENEDSREIWTSLARMWYSKAADKMPAVGRLYHHLAILARPHLLQQLFFYCKSLSVSNPFSPARESILTLFFEPAPPESPNTNTKINRGNPVDITFIKLHGICFTHIDFTKFDDALDEFLGLLDKHINKIEGRWKVQGCYIAVCNIASLYEYGARGSGLRRVIRESKQGVRDQEIEDAALATATDGAEFEPLLLPVSEEAPLEYASSEHAFSEHAFSEHASSKDASLLPPVSVLATPGQAQKHIRPNVNIKAAAEHFKFEQSEEHSELYLGYAKRLAFSTLDLVLQRLEDPNIHPHIHAWLAFLFFLAKAAAPALHLLEVEFPWDSLVSFLNHIVRQLDTSKYELESFPTPDKGIGRPLPEDWTLRGLDWMKGYFPDGWIENAQVDEERALELPSMQVARIERILWLAVRICKGGDWLLYNSSTRTFSVNPTLIQRLDEKKAEAALKESILKEELQEDEDMDIETTEDREGEIDIDDTIDDLSQSEELKELVVKRQQLRQLQSQLKTDKSEEPDVGLEARRISTKEILKPNYTIIVVDTNLLLSSLDIFKAALKTDEWTVVIPNTVVTELLGLSNNQEVGEFAKAAIIAIQDAVAAKKDVRVITAKGNNVTNVAFFKEKLEKYNEDDMSIDDVIICITEAQGKLRLEAKGSVGIGAAGAILITEDRNMRVKANARGVPAIAGSTLRGVLSPRDTGRSRSKRKTFTNPLVEGMKQKFPDVSSEVLAAVLQDANGDLETAFYKISQQFGSGRMLQPHSPNFKKRHKTDKDITEATSAITG